MQKTIVIPETSEGEKWVGVVLGQNGEVDYHLVRLPNKAADMSFTEAAEWAAAEGGEVPNRRELRLLWVNDKEFFDDEVFWSSEQHASSSGYAWCQNFSHGSQSTCIKSAELCAVAVRRVPI